MMKKMFYLMLCMFVMTMIVSCTSNPACNALNELEIIVATVEEYKDNLSLREWEDANKEAKDCMQIINEAIKNHNLSLDAEMKFVAVLSRWAAISVEIGTNDKTSSISDATNADFTTV